jgi:hypothetical protein
VDVLLVDDQVGHTLQRVLGTIAVAQNVTDGQGRAVVCVDAMAMEATLSRLSAHLAHLVPAGADLLFLLGLGLPPASAALVTAKSWSPTGTTLYGYMPTCASVPSGGGGGAGRGAGNDGGGGAARVGVGAGAPGSVIDGVAASATWRWSGEQAAAGGLALRLQHREWLASPAAVSEGMDAAVSDHMVGHGRVAWIDLAAGPVHWTSVHSAGPRGSWTSGKSLPLDPWCVCVCVCVRPRACCGCLCLLPLPVPVAAGCCAGAGACACCRCLCLLPVPLPVAASCACCHCLLPVAAATVCCLLPLPVPVAAACCRCLLPLPVAAAWA